MSLRVLVVDDNAVVRSGLRSLLEIDEGIDIVGEAADGAEALMAAAREAPDVVLLDVRMPNRDGLSVVAELAERTRVIMLTFSDEDAVIRRALSDGAVGYLVHGTFDAAQLSTLVRMAASGTSALSGPALDVLRAGPAEVVSDVASPDARNDLGLSARQAEVMELIAEGRSNREIAATLFVAEKTVKNHINQIFSLLGVETRAQAMVRWQTRE